MDLPIQIPMKEIYRYMGYPDDFQDVPANLRYMVEEEIAAALPFLVPKATYLNCKYDKETNNVITPDGGLLINGADIRKHLNNCTQVTLFTCTIGSTIESAIESNFKSGEFTRAIIIDAIGSAAVECAAEMVNQYIYAAAYHQKHTLVSRFSPGYGDWDLAIQKELVHAAGGQLIGIQVTDSSLLLPRKSVSGVIGWIPGLDKQTPPISPCLLCQIPNCNNPICKGGKCL
jgi:hypothetical protein